MANQLYLGEVMHRRFGEVDYRFRYGVLSLRVDVDQMEELSSSLKWFSLNRFNLYSLYWKDYGARNQQSWREWADDLLADYGLTESAHRIELVCFPRFLGFTFNPLAMWYAYNESDELIAIIAEVSNTFGQWHHYVLTDGGQPLGNRVVAQADKVFHVSPFIGMQCRYDFQFYAPGEHYKVSIKQTEQQSPRLQATQVGKAMPLSDANLKRALWTHPFNSLKTLFLIHLWALRIWFKGGRFHKTPETLESIKHSHTEMKLC